jgi:phytoene desaturase
MYRIVEALVEIAEHAGVEIAYNTTVERIEVDGGRARGVLLADGRRIEADAVLANADLPYVYNDLLPQDGLAKSLSRKRFSCSTISFFWGVDKPYEELGPHTLFLADDYRENFESIIKDLALPENPSLYIHAPSRLDAGMAPAGEDTLTAVVPVGHLDENGEQDWSAIRDQARRDVFRRLASLGITDLETHIKFEVSFTPLSWRKRYNLMKGATHGLCHNITQLAYLRPSNRHPRYHNLYFVGASTRPGTGVPTAMVSARLTAARLMEDLGLAPKARPI